MYSDGQHFPGSAGGVWIETWSGEQWRAGKGTHRTVESESTNRGTAGEPGGVAPFQSRGGTFGIADGNPSPYARAQPTDARRGFPQLSRSPQDSDGDLPRQYSQIQGSDS